MTDYKNDPDRIVQIIPGGGWLVTHYPDVGDEYTMPLVAWGLSADGVVVPLDGDRDGFVEHLRDTAGRWRLHHPQERPEVRELYVNPEAFKPPPSPWLLPHPLEGLEGHEPA